MDAVGAVAAWWHADAHSHCVCPAMITGDRMSVSEGVGICAQRTMFHANDADCEREDSECAVIIGMNLAVCDVRDALGYIRKETYLAMLRWTKTSPGRAPVMSDSGTRESAHPIQRTCAGGLSAGGARRWWGHALGYCPLADRSKKSGSVRSTDSAHLALAARRERTGETGWIIELSVRLRREIVSNDKSTVYDMEGFLVCRGVWNAILIPYMR